MNLNRNHIRHNHVHHIPCRNMQPTSVLYTTVRYPQHLHQLVLLLPSMHVTTTVHFASNLTQPSPSIFRNAHPAKHPFVVALDYSSMYPSSKEGSNIDTSSRLPSTVLTSPSLYSLSIVRRVPLNDVYGRREVIYLRRVPSSSPSPT